MLKKLLKYDIKKMSKFLLIFYSLLLIFALVTRFLNMFDETTFIKVLQGFSKGCLYSMMASILVNNLMREWALFNESIYKDESYLTHTLPVRKKDIYNSKFLMSFITLFVSFITIVLSIFIAFYTSENFNVLKEFLNGAFNGINMKTTFIIICILLILFLEIFNMLICGYLGLLLGHKKNDNKIFHSLIYGLIIYTLSQIFVVILFLIVGLFNKDIMNIFISNSFNLTILKNVILIGIISYIIIIFIIRFISIKVFNTGVNVD